VGHTWKIDLSSHFDASEAEMEMYASPDGAAAAEELANIYKARTAEFFSIAEEATLASSATSEKTKENLEPRQRILALVAFAHSSKLDEAVLRLPRRVMDRDAFESLSMVNPNATSTQSFGLYRMPLGGRWIIISIMGKKCTFYRADIRDVDSEMN
jgi:hypothetical protein